MRVFIVSYYSFGEITFQAFSTQSKAEAFLKDNNLSVDFIHVHMEEVELDGGTRLTF